MMCECACVSVCITVSNKIEQSIETNKKLLCDFNGMESMRFFAIIFSIILSFSLSLCVCVRSFFPNVLRFIFAKVEKKHNLIKFVQNK